VPVERKPFLKSGHAGWVIIAVGVLAWDFLAPETLTDAFRQARKHPVGAAAVAVTWGVLTAHLFELIPSKVDPIHRSTMVVRQRYGRHV
jgi:hypothetical protein